MFGNLKDKISKAKASVRRVITHASDAAGYSHMTHLTTQDFADRALQLQGRMASRALPTGTAIEDLSEIEFKVYSQWGEDGIIDWLVQHVPLPDRRFVEFGVETFREANCRFLMQNRNWKGLVMDGSDANLASLRQQAYFWMHDLSAKAAFVTAENINELLTDAGFVGDLAVLSIDLDGNDYWVWKAITAVNPAIVICEVNAILGDTAAVTIPYDASFARFSGHYSGLYFGASIKALTTLAEQKGYRFVGTNSNGINAFFVRNDLASSVLHLIRNIRAFPALHRDSRDQTGQMSYVGGLQRLALIADCPVVDVVSGKTVRFGDISNPYSDAWLDAMR